MKKSVAGLGLGIALMNVATGVALAHTADPDSDNDGLSEDYATSHGYANAETCTGLGGTAPAGPSETTDHVTNDGADLDLVDGQYPDPASAYGSFAADCNAVQGTDSDVLAATAHILASITLDDIINDTADVVDPGVSGINPGDSITAFDFPTQTSAGTGGVNSDTMHVEVTTNSDWELSGTITGQFEKVGDPTEIKPAASFGTDGPQGLQMFSGLNDSHVIETGLDSTDSASSGFMFRSDSASGVEAGDYVGEFTLTVTAV
jgi:hypothetical protein